MIEFFLNGGIPMWVINFFLLILLAAAAERFGSLFISKNYEAENLGKRLFLIKFLGLGSVIVGFLGTSLGMYMAFSRADSIIQRMGTFPIYKVIKISISTSIWGLTVAFLAIIFYFILEWRVERIKRQKIDSTI